MKTILIDCAQFNTKQKLLQKFLTVFEEMYSENYDALIDAATFCKEQTHLTFCNFERFEDPQDLLEVLKIIEAENPSITFDFEK